LSFHDSLLFANRIEFIIKTICGGLWVRLYTFHLATWLSIIFWPDQKKSFKKSCHCRQKV